MEIQGPVLHDATEIDPNCDTHIHMYTRTHYPGQKNRYSRDIHEIDLQCDHEISCDIDFDLQRELATRRYCELRRCQTAARYHMIKL